MDKSMSYRRRKSCQRCRKLKVRCYFEDDNEKCCSRCMKSGSHCEVLFQARLFRDPLERRSKRGGDVAGNAISMGGPAEASSGNAIKYAWVERINLQTRPANDDVERQNKISQLEKVIREATTEVDKLKSSISSPPYSSTNPSPQSAVAVGPKVDLKSMDMANWPQSIFSRKNCFDTALEAGLIDYSTAKELYNSFLGQMQWTFPFVPGPGKSFQVMVESSPVKTLIYVACASSSLRPNLCANLVKLCDRVIIHKLCIEGLLELDLVHALLLKMVFFHPPKLVVQNDIYTHLAIFLMYHLDLANLEHVRRLKSADPDIRWEAKQKIVVLLSIYTCTSAAALNRSNLELFKLLPNVDAAIDGYLECCEEFGDYHLSCGVLSVKTGRQCLDKIREAVDKQMPFSTVKVCLNEAKARLESLLELVGNKIPSGYDGTILAPVSTAQNQVMISAYELALNYLVFGVGTEHQNDGLFFDEQEFDRIAQEIIDLCLFNAEKFTEMDESVKPSLMGFRPLMALTSLVRLRMIAWSMNRTIDVDIEAVLHSVEMSWEKWSKTTYLGATSRNFLEKVQKWVGLKMADGGLDIDANGVSISSQMVANILKEIIVPDVKSVGMAPNNRDPRWHLHNRQLSKVHENGSLWDSSVNSMGRPLEEGTSASTTTVEFPVDQSNQDSEQLIRELFGDFSGLSSLSSASVPNVFAPSAF